ncbi:MAG TPA: PEGA domain-containing protein [Polyangiaceae bacterium]|nr:PEGA domain-containing protein [Polyangiaceae bacterium]
MIAFKLLRSALVLLLCLAVRPASALAQANANAPDPTSVEGKQAEGKERYERGAEAYAAGRYKDAIDLFLQADALAPSAALSFNIARAYEKISDDASTLQWYRDFRRRAPDAKNGPEVDQRIQQLEGVLASKGVQQLTVLTSPLGATVIIDEQPVGITPFTGQFAPGSHKVLLSLRGYADTERKVELAAERAQDLNVPLVPARSQAGVPPGPGDSGGEGSGAGSASQPRQPADRPSGPRFGIWPWVGIGAGAAVLGGALGVEIARRGAEKDAKEDETQVGYKEKLDTMKSRQTTARVLAAVGGALFITGGTLLVIDLTSRQQEAARARVRPRHAMLDCSVDGCALTLEGQF